MDVRFLLLSKIHPSAGGGAELRTWELAKRFARLGADVTILTIQPGQIKETPEVADGVRFEYLPPLPFTTRSDRLAFFMPRIRFFLSRNAIFRHLIEDQEMDLVHDDISPFPTLYPHWLCEKSNIPKLATIHNFQGSLVSWVRRYGIMGIGGSLGEGALRKGYLRYDHIITDSSWLQQDLAQDLPTHKVSWIPNGVDTNHFRPVKSTEIRSGVDGSVTFLCVGRFVGLKGHNVLLRSFVRLRKKGLKIRLVLVGTGPRLQAVKTLSEQLSIGSSVSFLDHVSHDRMPRIYQDADVFILPSISEGMSFALLEAMSSGLPTIASDIPGNRAVVDDATGILVPPRREEELSMAMERLAVDETQRQGMARSARRKIVKMFTWERIAQRQFDLFISCIENRRNDSS